MFTFEPTIGLGDIVSGLISAAGVLSAVFIFVAQQRASARLQRTEIYQRLELASVEVFKFEAENAPVLERFRDKIARPNKFGDSWPAIQRFAEMDEIDEPEAADKRDPSGELRRVYEQYRAIEDDVRVARKYYEQTLNLFEMAARFRADGIMDERVFGSWVIWYFDTVKEWAFRWMWTELELGENYTAELRETFDLPVFHFDWIVENEDALQRDFFNHVARLYGCKIIRDWLGEIKSSRENLANQIERAGVKRYPPWPRRYGQAPAMLNRKGSKKADALATLARN